MIAFTIPGEPQGKGRPRVGKIGGHARARALPPEQFPAPNDASAEVNA